MSPVIRSRLPVDAFGVKSKFKSDSSNGENDGRATGQIGIRTGRVLQSIGGAYTYGGGLPPSSGEVRSSERDFGAGTAAWRLASLQEH